MITSYVRPGTLDEALERLAGPDARPLAGGTWLTVRRPGPSFTAVDLQDLPLTAIAREGGDLRIGATATLQRLVDAPDVPPILADLARREAPRSLRNAATVGGTVALAEPDSELVTGLLAFGAVVTVARPGSRVEVPLEALLDDPGLLAGALVTEVSVPATGRGAAARTTRTPSDRPIVAAVAHRDHAGVRVALSGVAARPTVVDPTGLGALEPPGDFRGSAEYRRHLAHVLVGRVLRGVEVSG